jgi:hypothetical protein
MTTPLRGRRRKKAANPSESVQDHGLMRGPGV